MNIPAELSSLVACVICTFLGIVAEDTSPIRLVYIPAHLYHILFEVMKVGTNLAVSIKRFASSVVNCFPPTDL